MNARLALSTSLAALLAACTSVGPDYHAPQAATPSQWSTAPAASQHLEDWWQTFNDPLLNQLITEAVQSNLNLKLAETRIREARASRTGTIAAGLPAFGASSSLSRRRNNINAGGQSGGAGGFGIGQNVINIFQMGFDASWELDLFGGVRRAVESADALVASEQDNRRAVLVSLLGEVARNYIELRSNQQLLAVTEANLRSQQDTLQLTRVRYQAGLSSELETAQSEGLLAETRAQLPVSQAAIARAIHALSVLTGQPPNRLASRLEQPAPVPVSQDQGFADLPAAVVRRRPDIRQAERKLAATTADIGVAMAELYPRLSLTAFLGLQNGNIAKLTPMGQSWSMASSLTLPLFNWGRIKANIRAKEAVNDGALVSYQAAVLAAYQDIEDALSDLTQENQRMTALQQAAAAQQLALNLANERWRNGLSAYLDVLLAERSVLQSQRELVEAQARQSAQRVALYKALGGGWKIGEKPEENDDWLHETYQQLVAKPNADTH